MWKKLFEDGDLMALPQITLLAFVAIFVAVVLWVLRSARRSHYERMAELPLEDTTDFDVASPHTPEQRESNDDRC